MDDSTSLSSMCTVAAGSGGTFQNIYDDGGAGPQTITFDATRLGMRFKDAATPISGNLFDIVTTTPTNIFSVSASAVTTAVDIAITGAKNIGTLAAPIGSQWSNKIFAVGQANAIVTLYASSSGTDSATCGTATGASGCRTLFATNGLLAKVPTELSNVSYILDVTDLGEETVTVPARLPAFNSGNTNFTTGSGNTYFPRYSAFTILATPTNPGTLGASGGNVTINSSVTNIDIAGLRRVTINETLASSYAPTDTAAYFLVCNSGQLVAPIIQNTQVATSTIDISASGTIPTGAGVCYIGTPSATIKGGDASNVVLQISVNTPVQLSGLKIINNTGTIRALSIQNAPNLIISGSDIYGMQVLATLPTGTFEKSHLHMPDGSSGTSTLSLGGNIFTFQQSYLKNTQFFNGGTNGRTTFNLCALNTVNFFGDNNILASGQSDNPGGIYIVNTAITGSTGYGLTMVGGGYAVLNKVAFSNNTTGAIFASGRVRLGMTNVQNGVMMSTTTNGAGVVMNGGANIEVSDPITGGVPGTFDPTTGTWVTGTAGDFSTGNLGYSTWTILNTASSTNSFDVAGDGSHIYKSASALPGNVKVSGALAIATAQTPLISAINTTAAAAGAQQYSPGLTLQGSGWKTDATAAAQNVAFQWQTRPVQAAAAPTADMVLWYSINGGAYGERFNINSIGAMTLIEGITMSAAFGIGTAQTAKMTMTNSTAAAAGAQQFSPMLTLQGNGWKTNATAASQTVNFSLQTRPVEAAANPTGDLVIWSNVNGGGATERLAVDTSGNIKPIASATDGTAALPWTRVYNRIYSATVETVASGDSIAPVQGIVHITGTTTVNTITAPAGCTTSGYGCVITLIPDNAAGFSTGITGNIAVATVATQNKAVIMTYDPATTKWYPSY